MRTFEWCPSASALVGLFFFLSLRKVIYLMKAYVTIRARRFVIIHFQACNFFFLVYVHVCGLLHRAFDRVCEQDLFSFCVRTLCAIQWFIESCSKDVSRIACMRHCLFFFLIIVSIVCQIISPPCDLHVSLLKSMHSLLEVITREQKRGNNSVACPKMLSIHYRL